jgi:hypothetical protein
MKIDKVIETNLSLDDSGEIVDFQSRIIEVKSWNEYVNEIGNAESLFRISYVGNMLGNSLPKSARVENFSSNEKSLTCDVYSFSGVRTKKLAYLAERNALIHFENGSQINVVETNGNVIRGKGFRIDNSENDFKREYYCQFISEKE